MRFAKNYASKKRKSRLGIYPGHLRRDHPIKTSEMCEEDRSASAGVARGQPADFELAAHKDQVGGVVCQTCLQQPAMTGLGRLLCLDETVQALAKFLHPSDLRHLGQASRRTMISLYSHKGEYGRPQKFGVGMLPSLQEKPRFLVDSSPTHADRAELLSRSTCECGKRERCWSCATQICSLWKYQSLASAADIEHHINRCTLYCHRCYFREICLRQRGLRRSKHCLHSTKINGPQAPRLLCEPCSKMSEKNIGSRRERREKEQLTLLAAQAVRCGHCASSLPSGDVRWWVCTSCDLECPDRCHLRE